MSKQGADGILAPWESSWRVWEAMGCEGAYASKAIQEAQRILAAVEQDGHLKGYATLSELTSWDCWSWPIEGASNGGRVGTFLAEALKGFVEGE